MNPIFFAFVAGIAATAGGLMQKLASNKIDQALGAVLVSVFAVLFGVVLLIPRLRMGSSLYTPKGIAFIAVAGVCAFYIDYFALTAYSRGLPLSIGVPIIVGFGIALSTLIGFMMGEPFSFVKVGGIGLIFAGALILSVTVQ